MLEKCSNKFDSGWGAWTDYSSYENKEDEIIQCPNADRSYITQSMSRWVNIDDDDRQIKWLCSPPDNSRRILLLHYRIFYTKL